MPMSRRTQGWQNGASKLHSCGADPASKDHATSCPMSRPSAQQHPSQRGHLHKNLYPPQSTLKNKHPVRTDLSLNPSFRPFWITISSSMDLLCFLAKGGWTRWETGIHTPLWWKPEVSYTFYVYTYFQGFPTPYTYVHGFPTTINVYECPVLLTRQSAFTPQTWTIAPSWCMCPLSHTTTGHSSDGCWKSGPAKWGFS